MLNKTVGIIIAKENSIRFKGKNNHYINGEPLFWHNVQCLIDSGIQDIYVATDSSLIKEYCKNEPVHIIDRNVNIIEDEQAWFDVIKYCYYTLPEKYDIIVSILANCIYHVPSDVCWGINLLEKNTHLKEIRSFDPAGSENGIIMLRSDVLNKHEISNYLGCIHTSGKEIHYIEDIEDIC